MSDLAPPTTAAAIERFRRSLLGFYRERKRDLPWRGEVDPYRVLVSEVMLQQTRVEAVVPYYRRWMERFPDLESLAEAEVDDVLALWTGLGYYRRARNLHTAARTLRDRHGGALPSDVDALRELPGVGEYTAGAVASIAFGTPVPAVDGNVRRVLARLFDEPTPSAGQLRAWAGALVARDAPGAFNQALMELGATVCLPRSPACEECPVQAHCLAQARATAEERPAPRKRAPAKRMDVGVAVLLDEGGRVLLRKRPEDGLLGGTWEFPGEVAEVGEGKEAAARRAASTEGVPVRGDGERLGVVDHRFSHRAAQYHVLLFRGSTPRQPAPREDGREGRAPATGRRRAWVSLSELGEIPLPAAQDRIRRLVESAAQATPPAPPP